MLTNTAHADKQYAYLFRFRRHAVAREYRESGPDPARTGSAGAFYTLGQPTAWRRSAPESVIPSLPSIRGIWDFRVKKPRIACGQVAESNVRLI